MSNFVIINPMLGNPTPVSLTATVQQFALGQTVQAEDRSSGKSSVNVGAGQFVYAQGSNVTVLGQFVHISNSSAVLLASGNSTQAFQVGIAAGNLSATNVFGWVQIGGICDYGVGTNSSVAAGQALYFCATAGCLASASAAGSRVQGVVCPVSYTSSQSRLATYQIFNAFVPGVTALQ